MKTRYTVLAPDRCLILASLTLYGDRDEETDRVLLGMIREALSIAAVYRQNGDPLRQEVILRREQVDI